MPHKNKIWLNPKGYEAFRQICSIVIPILIIIVLYLIAFCIITSSPSSETGEVTSSASPVYIMTVFELQQALSDNGYKVKVDGKVGKETIEAWDSYCHTRFANQFMTKTGEPK